MLIRVTVTGGLVEETKRGLTAQFSKVMNEIVPTAEGAPYIVVRPTSGAPTAHPAHEWLAPCRSAWWSRQNTARLTPRCCLEVLNPRVVGASPDASSLNV